jgi:hypothetical protein
MNLSDFCSLVANLPAPESDATRSVDEEACLEEIRGCFTPAESDQSLRKVVDFLAYLGIRHLCDGMEIERSWRVAQCIQQALHRRGNSPTAQSDWSRAASLADRLVASHAHHMPIDQSLSTNARISTLSHAVRILREKGYRIDLPAMGGIDMPDSELMRLVKKIHQLAESLGWMLATSAAGAMCPFWNDFTGRFNLGRPGHSVQIDATPQQPLAYLYQLGLRYFSLEPTASDPQRALTDLLALLTNATAMLDLVPRSFDLMFARVADVVPILRQSTVYDSVFLVTQAKVSHVKTFLDWMMRHPSFVSLKSKSGTSASQVHSLASMLLYVCTTARKIDEFTVIPPVAAAVAVNADVVPAVALLRDIFCHKNGANQSLTFPPKDEHVDAAFRPLLAVGDALVMQPPSIGARAVLNATMDWCRRAWPKGGNFDSEALGPMFEEFVRDKLSEKGVTVLCGDYDQAGDDGECDAVIETNEAVIFIELKSKLLTRKARSGDDLAALVDLAQAIVRPQAQAMSRHATLARSGVLRLRSKSGEFPVILAGREVLKVSITRGDLGSLHDRPFLAQFLKAGSVANFETVDPQKQGQLKDLGRWFKKLKVSAQSVGEDDYLKSPLPYSRCWSLSVFHLLLLLESTVDNETFSSELQRTRRLITPLRDFYEEYAYARHNLQR